MNVHAELAQALPGLAEAAMSFAGQQILAAATVHTYVVATYVLGVDGVACRSIDVVQAHSQPDPAELAPEGVELIRASVWPVEMLRTMPLHQRSFGMANIWRAYLMWNRAQDLGKPVAELQPWVDFDPITIDTDVASWVAGRRVAA